MEQYRNTDARDVFAGPIWPSVEEAAALEELGAARAEFHKKQRMHENISAALFAIVVGVMLAAILA